MGRRLRPQTPAFFFFGLIGNIPCRISLKQTQPSSIRRYCYERALRRRRYGRADWTEEFVSLEEELGGAIGSATPAVCEPSPSFCSVRASNLPDGFKPCAPWNFFIPSTVASSHLPLGAFAYDPFFASAF